MFLFDLLILPSLRRCFFLHVYIYTYNYFFIAAVWKEYTGSLMELCQGRRGTLIDMKFVTSTRGSIVYEIPLAEVTGQQCDSSCIHTVFDLFLV